MLSLIFAAFRHYPALRLDQFQLELDLNDAGSLLTRIDVRPHSLLRVPASVYWLCLTDTMARK